MEAERGVIMGGGGIPL